MKRRHGVDTSTPLLLEVAPEIDIINQTSFYTGRGRGVVPPPDLRYRLALAMCPPHIFWPVNAPDSRTSSAGGVTPSRTHPQHGYTLCAGAQAPPLLGPMSRKPFPQRKIYHYTPGTFRHPLRGKSGPALGGTEYRLMPSACRLIVRQSLWNLQFRQLVSRAPMRRQSIVVV